MNHNIPIMKNSKKIILKIKLINKSNSIINQIVHKHRKLQINTLKNKINYGKIIKIKIMKVKQILAKQIKIIE